VAQRAGIEFEDVDTFICCGFPLKSANLNAALLMGAYNLSIAQSRGLDVMTLCSSCTSALTETAHRLDHDDSARRRVNQDLERLGLTYRPGARVRHIARILYEERGKEAIRDLLVTDLSGMRVASHYGCHYLKPSEIYGGFDDPENPRTLDELVALTGAKIVDYKDKNRCCGGPLLPVDENTSMAVANAKLQDLAAAGAEAMCLVCPFCAVMYDSNQKGIESAFNASYNLPVLYLTQVLGLAMGFDRKELGLNMNVVKNKELLARYLD
jgi:heterodisulfide reductase subunit B